jgi:hypothetical protein
MPFVTVALCAMALTMLAVVALRADDGGLYAERPMHKWTALDLAALDDAQLAKIDPIVMNLVVARGIPGLERLDIGKYTRMVDALAAKLDEANRRAERYSKDDATYRVSREFWMAGGMAVALAGPSFGIRYTTEPLDASRPEQQFVHGVLDRKMGTCATMPVLYMAIGHRLGWPIRAVVSGDHMWARWDDGKKGGQRFNLEATSATSSGGMGSFNSLSDEEYAEGLQTPAIAIRSGSDFTSLTPRQTLGVFLQGRAAYWATRDEFGRAEQDLLLALQCFPQNRDLRMFLLKVQAHIQPRFFERHELSDLLAAMGRGDSLGVAMGGRLPRGGRAIGPVFPDVNEINRQNAERLRRETTRPDLLSPGSPIPGLVGYTPGEQR